MKYGKLIIAVVLMLSLSVFQDTEALAEQQWPTHMEPFLKATDNCKGMGKEFEVPDSGGSGPSKAFIAFQVEMSCRLIKVRDVLSSNPERVCPGMTHEKFNDCYESVLLTLLKKPGLTHTGLVQMLTMATMYLAKNKGKFPSKTEAQLELFNSGWKTLEHMDLRVKADRFGQGQVGDPQVKSEVEGLASVDEDATNKTTRMLLARYEKELNKIEKELESDRSPASLQLKLKVIEHRKTLLKFSKRLNIPLIPR